MECADRIAGLMAEMTLEPIKLMRERTVLTSVTVRVLSEGHRFDLEVRKRWPDGVTRPAVYLWSLREVGEDGAEMADGTRLDSGETVYGDPEDAYWAAVESVICAA